MNRAERESIRASLKADIDAWVNQQQGSETPIDCYIAGNTVELTTDAALAVLEAVEDTQTWLKSEGYLND
jgi:hypothetical protein